MIRGEKDFLHYLETPDDWELVGKYDIPSISAIRVKDKFNPQLVEFHEAHRVLKEQRKNKVVHFFLPDYIIERVWSRLKQNSEFLSGFKAVLSPDFSQYTDMPKAMKIWNHYRKMWVSKYWTDQGIRVIPVAGWSDEDSFEYCFDGMPTHSLIAVSSVGVHRDKQAAYLFEKGYNKMLETLEPSRVLFYGKPFEFVQGDVIYAKHSRDERFKGLRVQKQLESVSIPVLDNDSRGKSLLTEL